MATKRDGVYRTITGRRIELSRLDAAEHKFLAAVRKKYRAHPGWTAFSSWWNKEFDRAKLKSKSLAYRICQDLEDRLGIDQGLVSPPDYRDSLADLIDEHYSSRQEFCAKNGIDPGQLSRVFAGKADLSIKVLEKVLKASHARLVVQPDAELPTDVGIEEAERALALA